MGLISKIELNKGSLVDSVSGLSGTLVGTCTLNKSNKGYRLRELSMVGANGVTITNSTTFTNSGDWSLTIPVKTIVKNSNNVVCGIVSKSVTNTGWNLYSYTGNVISFRHNNSFIGGWATPGIGEEVFITLVYKSGTMYFYSNNILMRSDLITITSNNNTVIVGGYDSTTALRGLEVGSLKMWNHALTDKERNKEYAEYVTSSLVLEPKRGFQLNKPTDLSDQKNRGLVAAYNMKPIGNTLVDISGNGKNGTLVGSPMNSPNGMIFNGVTSKISGVAIPTIDLLNSFSVSFRFKCVDVSTQQLLFENAPVNRFTVEINAGRIAIGSYNVASTLTAGRQSEVVNNNQWYNVTYNWNASSQIGIGYLNGILFTGTHSPGNLFAGAMSIGAAINGTRFFKGEIEDLRCYNRVLTLQEIKSYHNQFVKQPYLIEDFSDQPADGTNIVPTGWIKGTGNYKVGEFVKSQTLLKSDFESGATGWSANGGTVLLSTEQKRSGTQSFKLTPSLVNQYIRPNNSLTLIKGKQYEVSGWVYSQSGTAALIQLSGTSVYRIGGPLLIVPNVGWSYVKSTFVSLVDGINNMFGIQQTVGTEDVFIDDFLVVEIDPLPTIKNRSKYLECTTAGTIAIPSDQAYGTWEFDWYKGGDGNSIGVGLNSFKVGDYNTALGYYFQFDSTEKVYLWRNNGAGVTSSIMITAISYIQNFTWHRIKITRTQSGVFTTYIKGGAFGTNWVLVSTAGGSGTNPVTDNTYTTSNFFVCDLDAGDRITNLRLLKGIEV